MASFNASFQFSDKKKNTVPYVAVPTNVKESLCIDSIEPEGIFKLEPMDGIALYDQCYVFEDINYINQDDSKKTSTLLELMKFFKTLDYQVKFTIASDQRDIKKYVSEIYKPIYGEEYPEIETGIGQWLNQKINEGKRDIRRIMYLTVTCKAQSFEDARAYFVTLDTTLQGIFTFLKSRLYRLSGEERLAVLQKILRVGETGIVPHNLSPEKDDWKNQILPVSIISGEDCMKINSRYVSVLFAQDYDTTLHEDKVVNSLTDTLFPTYITLDIEPIEKRIVRDKLMASHTNNETAISNESDLNLRYNQYTKGTSFLLEKKKNELESLISKVDDNDEEGIFLGMLVIVPAESMEELVQRVDKLKLLASANGYTLQPYNHRQLKALNTALPIGGRQVNHMRSLLTSSAVAFQPFFSTDLQDKDGFVLGINRDTKRLLIGNKKLLKSPHSIIVGHTGSGKSMFMKITDIAQTLLFTDDDIFCIDPNNELEFFCIVAGGQYVDFTPQCAMYLNPFEVPLSIWDADGIVKNRYIAKKCDYAGRFTASCMKNIVVTQIHLNFVERATREVYEEYFNQKDYNTQPTLLKIRDKLIQYQETVSLESEKRILLDITNSLEAFTIGVYDMFAHESNIDITNRLIAFGLKNIPENAQKPFIVTLMHCIQMQVEFNREELKTSRLIVDETQMLCEDEYSSTEILKAIETYRKFGGVITLMFQNLTHALERPNLRDMFSNCPCKVFFDQGGVDAAKLAEIQELSQKEFDSLNEDVPGYGLLVWDKKVYRLDARIDKENVLYSHISTNFHEKAEEKAQAIREERGENLKDRILHLLSITPMDEETLTDMCSSTNKRSEVKKFMEELLQKKKISKDDSKYHITENK